MVESADAPDSKSGGVKPVRVQVPPSAPLLSTLLCVDFLYLNITTLKNTYNYLMTYEIKKESYLDSFLILLYFDCVLSSGFI